MSQHVALFFIPDMERENALASAALRRIPDVELEEVLCEPSMRRMYTCPFVRDEAAQVNYYGVEGIEAFVDERLKDRTRTREKSRGGSLAHAAR